MKLNKNQLPVFMVMWNHQINWMSPCWTTEKPQLWIFCTISLHYYFCK